MKPSTRSSERGFSLAETVIALGVLITGVLGAAGILAAGVRNLSSSPSDVIVTQKAAQAVEAVFAARDSHKFTWSQLRNVSDGGIFLDGPQSLKLPGPDGLVNTADDGAIETIDLPGRDGILQNADDQIVTLSQFTREIKITDVTGENGQLRSLVVTIIYYNGANKRTYTLSTFISAYS